MFFNNWAAVNEQELFQDLSIEFIKIYGIDFWYLPRTLSGVDPVLTEDDSSSYESAHMIEMYVKNGKGMKGFTGLGDIMSKFSSGPAFIDDKFTLAVAKRSFQQHVGDATGRVRPMEGDLVFFPLNNKVYKVTFVEHESIFYQHGDLHIYELDCTMFEYSGETFNTGIPEVDAMDDEYSTNMVGQGAAFESEQSILMESGIPLVFEPDTTVDDILNAQNDYFQEAGEDVIDWTELDAFTELPDGHY